MERVKVLHGDVLEMLATLPDESVNCCVSSPPYFGLRDYGVPGQIGLERSVDEYVEKMTAVYREVRRVLTKDGTCWMNLGDSYSARGNSGGNGGITNIQASAIRERGWRLAPGYKVKELLGIPWRVAFALQADGWWLRSEIIWAKPNPMPESVTDRRTKAHEQIFLLSKSERYFYDQRAIADKCTGSPLTTRGNGEKASAGAYRGLVGKGTITEYRNKRTVWEIATQSFEGAHFAVFPEEIPRLCISAGCPVNGTVLDPFAGSGTTLAVAVRLGRKAVGIELNESYLKLIHERVAAETPALDFEGAA